MTQVWALTLVTVLNWGTEDHIVRQAAAAYTTEAFCEEARAYYSKDDSEGIHWACQPLEIRR